MSLHPVKKANALPTPSAAQSLRSEALSRLIQQKIADSGGWLPFDAYMNLALYTPELGYYTNDLSPFSMWAEQGDFITAPLLSPLFGACLAEQAIEVFELMPDTPPRIIEFGAGSGRLAADIVQHLALRGIAVEYQIMELSASLRAQQQATLHDALAHTPHQHTFTWLDALPEQFNGVMIGNEVLDAMPVRLIGMNQ